MHFCLVHCCHGQQENGQSWIRNCSNARCHFKLECTQQLASAQCLEHGKWLTYKWTFGILSIHNVGTKCTINHQISLISVRILVPSQRLQNTNCLKKKDKMRWNHYRHHRLKDKKQIKKGKKTLYSAHIILTITYNLWLWSHFLDKENKVQQQVTCSRRHSHKVRTRSFNSEPDLAGWVQRSIFYCYVHHLPTSSSCTGRDSLKCISGDYVHLVQRSPAFGSFMSNGDT